MRETDWRTGRQRLLRLAEFLSTLPPERFDYNSWVGEDWKGKPDLSCGTTACALGWATTIPEFNEAGLSLRADQLYPSMPYFDPVFFMDGEAVTALGAAVLFFGLSRIEAGFLFIPCQVVLEGNELREAPAADASPRIVAEHIERFVRRKDKELELTWRA